MNGGAGCLPRLKLFPENFRYGLADRDETAVIPCRHKMHRRTMIFIGRDSVADEPFRLLAPRL